MKETQKEYRAQDDTILHFTYMHDDRPAARSEKDAGAVREIQYQIQRRSEWLESVSYMYVSRTLKEVKPDERWKTISNNLLNIEFVNVEMLNIFNDIYDKWSSKTIVINLTSYFEFTGSIRNICPKFISRFS